MAKTSDETGPTRAGRVTVTGARALAMTMALAGLVIAAGVAPASEDAPRRLGCAFGEGTVSTLEGADFRTTRAEPLSFELLEIDIEAQTARLKAEGAVGAGIVRVIRAINANHYLEVAAEGFLNLTTVYDRNPATGTHPAIHSRHLGVVGQPVYARYTGACRALD